MNDEQLKILITVADNGSFSKAEHTYYMSKQAMMKHINSLENEVGFKLLQRTVTGVKLTDAGKIFYEGAKHLLNEQDKILEACNKLTHSECIRIGSVEHQVVLDPVNDLFTKRYPEIKLQKVVHPNHSGEYRVSSGIIDVGESFFSFDQQNALYCFDELFRTPFKVAMSFNHPLSNKDTINLSDLCEYQLYYFHQMVPADYIQKLKNSFIQHPENLLKRSDVDNQIHVAYQISNTSQLLLTANPFIDRVPNLKVIQLNTDWIRIYGIIYRKHPSSAVQKYIETAKEYYRGL